jgi:hypothetical protein
MRIVEQDVPPEQVGERATLAQALMAHIVGQRADVAADVLVQLAVWVLLRMEGVTPARIMREVEKTIEKQQGDFND